MDSEVWMFFPPFDGLKEIESIRGAIRRECAGRGWLLQERRTQAVSGRFFVPPGDVDNLYRRLHRMHVAVISIQRPGDPGPMFSMRPPRGSLIRWKQVASLRHLVRHKAFFHRLRWDRKALGWVGAFSTWPQSIGCSGIADPRCLPLHVFRCGRHWSRQLLRDSGRADFDQQYGPGSHRTDDGEFVWGHGPYHGNAELHVSGCALPRGFHWDVQGQGTEFWTPTQVWLVREYLNVAPDAAVSGREPYAKRLPLEPLESKRPPDGGLSIRELS